MNAMFIFFPSDWFSSSCSGYRMRGGCGSLREPWVQPPGLFGVSSVPPTEKWPLQQPAWNMSGFDLADPDTEGAYSFGLGTRALWLTPFQKKKHIAEEFSWLSLIFFPLTWPPWIWGNMNAVSTQRSCHWPLRRLHDFFFFLLT